MKKSLVIMLLVLARAALVQQWRLRSRKPRHPAGQQQPAIKDPAEYNAYINAIQQSNPAQKAQALEAFLQTYPNSVMKEDASGAADGRLSAGGRCAEDHRRRQPHSAGRIPTTFARWRCWLTTIACRTRRAAAECRQNLDKAQTVWPAGDAGLPEHDQARGHERCRFHQVPQRDSAPSSTVAVGFVALQKKDYATAQKDFHEAVSEESQPTIARYLSPGDGRPGSQADESGRLLVHREGGARWPRVPRQQQILDYGRKKYIRYHGTEEGWTELVNQAKASQQRHAAGRLYRRCCAATAVSCRAGC